MRKYTADNSSSNAGVSKNNSKSISVIEPSMGKLSLRSHPDPVDVFAVSYPERSDEPDCSYYMRTGSCAYGSNCRYNHPPNLKQGGNKVEFPERVGQPECQFYLKTGTCKFGALCKYHHPRDKNGAGVQTAVNYLGLPIRQGEKECAYYMRTGSCKYGINCKYHHPPPTAVGMGPAPNYGGAGSQASPASTYPQGLMSWPLTRPPYVQNPRVPASPTYLPVYFSPPQGMMPMQWNKVQGPLTSLLSPERHQQTVTGNAYGSPQQNDMQSVNTSPLLPRSTPMGVSAPSQLTNGPKEAFPERHGQPECQYYMKTGDCKFGSTCKYDHPKERVSQLPACPLSPMGLPLRPDQQPCSFYSRYGVCKFGPTCKFDHPVVGMGYDSAASTFSEHSMIQNRVHIPSTTILNRSSSSENSQVVTIEKEQFPNLENSAHTGHRSSPDGMLNRRETDIPNTAAAVSIPE